MTDNSMQTDPQKPGLSYRFVKYFLDNPQLTLLLFLMLVIVGIGSFLRLRVEGFPEIKVPLAIVTTVVPGAGPGTVQNTVTEPIQNSLKDLKGVTEISATSQANFSIVLLNFDDSTDINIAVQDARNKVSGLDLPAGVGDSEITIPDTGGAPFYIAVTGGADLLELRREALLLEERLLSIDGVKSFTEISGIDEKIYIELGPQYQNPQIIDQIKSANVGFPLGETTIDGKLVPVAAKSSITSLDDIRAIQITLPDNTTKPLSEIASVYVGVDYANKVHRTGFLDESENKFKIQPAVLYAVRLEKNADLLELNTKVEEVVAETRPASDKVDYAIVQNQAQESQNQVDEILAGAIGEKWHFGGPLGYVGFLFGGMWLLLIGMLLLLDWRTALISVISIPLSFLFTFIVLAVAGIQLNTLVLFSFVLVLGLIVDPAIIVLESIRRYVDLGYKGRTAVLKSINVIGLGLFVAVVTSMIVFIPFSVVSGTFGELISYIPWTVFPALTASYFIPLIFLTWLGAKYIKPRAGSEIQDEDDVHTLWPFARWFININRYILNRKALQVAVVGLGLAIPIAVTAVLFSTNQVRQVQFSQPDDTQYVQVSIPRPANQTYRDLQIMSSDVEGVLKNYVGEMKNFFYQSMDGSSSDQTLSVFIELVEPADRDRKSPEITKAITADLKTKFGDKVQATEFSAGPPGEAYPVSVKIFESDPAKLKVASDKLSAQLRTYPEVDQVITDYDAQGSELSVQVDSAKAAAVGLAAPAVYGQVAAMLGESTLFRLEETSVIVRVPEDTKPATRDALLSSIVFGAAGPVRLGDIATINEATVPGSIRSLNGERYSSVSASIKDARDAINVQRTITEWAQANTNNLGVNDRAFEERAGVNEFEKSFQELFLAIFLSILVTYVALVVFFRSFIQPLIILASIPLILLGVFPALAIFTGGQFGFLETIGILMVIGIAENVGIFLIDYANRKVKEGVDKKEAIALASGIRLRPIILTKITALAGLLPLAVFSPFWRGLSLVVIFGILSSGILSLFTTPVLYNWFTRVKKPAAEANDDEPDLQDPLPFTELPPNLPIA